jgi:hypothetical protein
VIKKNTTHTKSSYFDIVTAFYDVAVVTEEIGTAEIAVFMALLYHRNNQKPPYQCNPKIENILKRAKNKLRSVNESIRILKKHGLVKSVRKRSNWYCFIGDPRFTTFNYNDTI